MIQVLTFVKSSPAMFSKDSIDLIAEMQRVDKLDMMNSNVKSSPEERLADSIVDNFKVLRLVHKLLNSVVENDFEKICEEDRIYLKTSQG